MNFWKIDLTTRDGAENAASAGGLMSFIAAGMTVLGGLLVFLSSATGVERVGAIGGVLLEFLIFLIAGLRLRTGRGLVWGIVATVLLGIEIVMKLIGLSIVGTVINLLILVGLVNGVRAAATLRRDTFPEDVADVFS